MDYNRFIDLDTLRKIIKGEHPFGDSDSHGRPYLIEIKIDSVTVDKAFIDLILKRENE